jgi:hypothetical protein
MTLMRILRARFLMTIISSIVMLQILNISIDPADPNLASEDLSINDIESCVELVLEVVLDKTGAIEETDDRDEDSRKPATSITFFSVEKFWKIDEKEYRSQSSTNSYYRALSVPNFAPAIISPPPKAF